MAEELVLTQSPPVDTGTQSQAPEQIIPDVIDQANQVVQEAEQKNQKIEKTQRLLGMLGPNLLNRAANNPLVDADGNERLPQSPGEKSLEVYKQLRDNEHITARIPKADTAEKDLNITTLDVIDDAGKPLQLNNVRIAGITGGTRDNVICYFEDEQGLIVVDSQGKQLQVPIPRASVLDAQLVADKDAILSQFTGNQKKMLELHIDALQGNTDGLDATGIDQEVVSVATESGMLTNEKVVHFIDNIPAASLPIHFREADSSEYIDKKIQELKDVAKKALGENEIVDTPQMLKVLGALGISQEGFMQQAKSRTDYVTELTENYNKLPASEKKSDTGEKIKKKIEELTAEVDFLEAQSTLLGENGPLRLIIDDMNNGTLPAEQLAEMQNDIQNGDLNSFMEHSVDALRLRAKLTPEEMQNRIKEMLKNKKIPKGLLWAIMLFIGQEIYNTVSEQAA